MLEGDKYVNRITRQKITVIIECLKVTSMTTQSLSITCRPINAISRSLTNLGKKIPTGNIRSLGASPLISSWQHLELHNYSYLCGNNISRCFRTACGQLSEFKLVF